MEKIVVFFPTYNEAGNVVHLVRAIREYLPESYILAVDDASPDGTGQILEDISREYGRIEIIHRPVKMGIGSAHKLAMKYSIENDFDILITMDADFSHHPQYLPVLLSHLADNDFVTGSRYMKGGSSDYGFYRTFISKTANIVARFALKMKLHENTTVYRGIRVPLLKKLNFDEMKSEGYSFAIESLFRISKMTDKLVEFPIHFENRRAGNSKISKVEIYKAVLTICRLSVDVKQRMTIDKAERHINADITPVICRGCGGIYQTEMFKARKNGGDPCKDTRYSCSNHTSRTHEPIIKCLQCGLIFMKPRLDEAELIKQYSQVEDPTYLKNLKARELTSSYTFSRIRQFLSPGKRLLDVGSYCGVFLKVATDNGVAAEGLEPSVWAANISSQITKAPVYRGTLNNMEIEPEKFDLITLWDVLEHFYDPVKELTIINKLLKPDGKLFFSTLMVDNWFPRLTGKYWPWYMDMHLYYFTEHTLSNMLARCGFTIVESQKYCHIITLEYLLSRLAILGIPGAGRLGKRLSQYSLARKTIPFKFGDIKLFVCQKRFAIAELENFNENRRAY